MYLQIYIVTKAAVSKHEALFVSTDLTRVVSNMHCLWLCNTRLHCLERCCYYIILILLVVVILVVVEVVRVVLDRE